ncbi:MAG: 16S rRNA (adenine(1518)-N(6)/adenine(1519)-N(6))-dimethyltransferase RsmA [Nitrospirae bacterium]|nr:16S rRNA (adenine(1518)-N(6)/adenine(1519)-N(6))-dimethyltransferase RsmA [Nitrospirota bacterium]MCL5421217.1 16S rRNA (adenine(1518)-N(6)/adenine(1519)-N(6))-dimethyltransferase RsmA [Nitrospirota bacterium]
MAKKRLGQNFLFDPSILKRIVQAARLSPDDTVVEIGPGPGRMTVMLAGCVKKVIAIELDRELYERLSSELSGYDNIDLVHGDALKFPYETLGEFKVVANIPYYITTPILFKLLEHRDRLISITVTIQKEVAERIVARPGGKEYGVLSLMIQYYGNPKLEFIVPRGAFRPVPKVDSAVIHIEISQRPSVAVKDEKLFFRVIKTAFSQRRKMLLNSLKPITVDIKERLILAGIEPSRRPETLSIEEFARLADVLGEPAP